MNHQDFLAALKEALAEAKRRFEEDTKADTRKRRNPRFEARLDGVYVRYQYWVPHFMFNFPGQEGRVHSLPGGSYWGAANKTYTWEELMP